MGTTPKTGTQSIQQTNREIIRCFCISILMLLIPVGFVLLVGSLGIKNKSGSLLKVFLVLWPATAFVGLLYGVRALRLSDRRTDGFGILALFLHIGSLLFLIGALVASASHSAE